MTDDRYWMCLLRHLCHYRCGDCYRVCGKPLKRSSDKLSPAETQDYCLTVRVLCSLLIVGTAIVLYPSPNTLLHSRRSHLSSHYHLPLCTTSATASCDSYGCRKLCQITHTPESTVNREARDDTVVSTNRHRRTQKTSASQSNRRPQNSTGPD